MSGLTATVLLRTSFTPGDSARVTQILQNAVADVTETRKGRHWWFRANEGVASISVRSTLEHSHDFEDDLLAHFLDFDDAPEAFVLCFSTRRPCDRDECGKLAAVLAKAFGGIDCGLDS